MCWFALIFLNETDHESHRTQWELMQCDNYGIPHPRGTALGRGTPLGITRTDKWIAVAIADQEQTIVSIVDSNVRFGALVRVRICLRNAAGATCSFAGNTLVIADTTGRLLTYRLDGDRLALGDRIFVS